MAESRQRELRLVLAVDTLARIGLTVGAPLTVFLGPIGLTVLIPSILATVMADFVSRRVVQIGGVLPVQERLALRHGGDYERAIGRHADYLQQVAHWRKRLRFGRLRSIPLLRRLWHRRRPYRDVQPGDSLAVHLPVAQRPRPGASLPTSHLPLALAHGEVFEPFAAALLRSRRLRRAFAGQGVRCEGRTWSVDGRALSQALAQPTLDPQLRRRVLELADEAWLGVGALQRRLKMRALLDAHYEYIKSSRDYL
ncbi:MAG: hypothetical protein EOO40_08820 [Deltaproteobacteria bacterium]|nr:MAG: hypothetical protein EOO40_08820 [Deltaproteobacteria bacterium]